MRKFILLSVALLAILTGCSKNDSGTKTQTPAEKIAQIKSDIQGTWYYKSFSVDYYYQSTELLYTITSTATDLYNDPTYQFNSDNTASYENVTFNYQVTVNGSADSIICSGNNTSRLCIVSENPSSLVLTNTYIATVPFTNIQTGAVLYSNIATSHPTLSRTRAKKP
jgi:hypothetical protein